MQLSKYMTLTAIVTASAINYASATYVGPSPSVPPADGHYLSDVGESSIYGGLPIIVKNIDHTGFVPISSSPIAGGTLENFDSILNADMSVSGSPFTPASLTGPVSVAFLNNYTPGAQGTFSTEMLSLNLSGTSVFGPMLIRESPTLQSTGSTTVAAVGGGLFQIDSFFDVFTELSIDGGQSWMPDAAGSHRVVLSNLPEPTLLGMLSLASGLMLRRRKN